MKRSSVLLLVAIEVLMLSQQTDIAAGKTSSVGVKGGINIAKLNGDDAEGAESKTDFIGGVFVSIGIDRIVSLQPEILLSRKGAQGTAFGYEGEVELNYLEIPLLFKASLPSDGAIIPHLFVGPALSFSLSARATGKSSGFFGVSEQTVELDDQVQDFDLGLVFGGGLNFNFVSAIIVVDGRYNLGLKSIDAESKSLGIGESDFDLKNGVFSIMIGAAASF
ncbi:MAG: outer membrane beta-barrel protein [Candidatus Latescibacteria bacterium]|nr:outer membrane beta-barrel protein [Candidatus Latescibacterota bacterium]NIM22671.1 outer membrane beta-barrel protein [Candidatus Latescibacterota bacterium]NIM64960.1 outer membrane beta-barrel protein [Candidatus Latescibacterota bacterium]NIO01475.1 outer membrane beta-barrel protein [Candidatus Latescibacterota bacterium]NIO27985.1 outer membrane beta-barrel protein [Candidatus Latescibacterota bacterium]